ncbi:glutathione reductase [Ensifer sp. Root142]|uniref:glutathione-disulfide reductase n=1 Tax=Ensifer TaxID=106591 RepID=UPI00070C868A|nr:MULTISPECIES: glutathione-disulfide reductase [Ensifer]KQY72474.1 glutathione reductase [Ensifer sp. Root142]MDP9632670.1 glutathione reductase (NADPH) [Ensifer adhaerens]NOV17806.1 glutathione-disulfide reductase [Ensifer canadensis]
MSFNENLDLFVIGGGSGGVRAARVAAEHGARVAIAEQSRFGGTCVIRGCVPKKLLVYAGRFKDEFESSRAFGWNFEAATFDWKTFRAKSDAEIARLERAYRSTLEKSGVEIFDDRALVETPNTIRLVNADRCITAKQILVATGSRPALANFPGCEHLLTSDDVFSFEKVPERLLFVGGGYIAVEFASIFAHLGTKTTIAYRAPRLLRGFDLDISDHIETQFKDRGIDLVAAATISSIEQMETGGFRVVLTNSEVLEEDAVVSATGRLPNTPHLGLEEVGVKLDFAGAILVNREHRTSIPSIFAVGDVVNRANLTPVAIRAGHALSDKLFGNIEVCCAAGPIPTAVFTTPEVGTVGLSEEAARQTYENVRIFRSEFTPMKASFAAKRSRTLMKLVVDGLSDKVLGVHVVGADAGEIIQMASVALTMGATKADFDRTVAVHPTASEELVTMRLELAQATE